jgi:trehalose 6-phosphate synthase
VSEDRNREAVGDQENSHLPASARRLLSHVTLILASNRGPVEFQTTDDGGFVTKRGTGGVVTAVSAVSRYSNPIWVASAMTEGDRERARRASDAGEPVITPEDSDFRLRFVLSKPEEYDGYYNRISNPLLWFLQHYLWDSPRTPDIDAATWDEWRHGYVTVNRQFAREIVAAAQAASRAPIVMLQDYHLYLAPGFIRELRPDLTLQHFIHIPWPDSEYWQLVPGEMREAICASLLANDIVGFQTFRYARAFMNTCAANLDDADIDYVGRAFRFRGRTTRIRVYPISIDCDAVREVAFGDDAQRHLDYLQAFCNEYTIVRVDRAEPSKNIVRGFVAYDRFLEEHPEFAGKVNFLAFLVPSRMEVLEYVNYLDEINAAAGRVNTKYATIPLPDGIAWQPITLFIGDDYARALAGMRCFDALIVNSIFDGMNLVAKEGALVNERNGPIILSEAAGAFQQLGPHSLCISPTDIEGTAQAIYAALTMPPVERAERAAALRSIVLEQDIRTWIYQQLEDLADLIHGPVPYDHT